MPSFLIFFNFSLPKKLASESKFTYLSKPHSKGLSLLSKSFPYDKRPLSILSIRFGHPGFKLNSSPISK